MKIKLSKSQWEQIGRVAGWKKCPTCKGKEYISDPKHPKVMMRCPECFGDGLVKEKEDNPAKIEKKAKSKKKSPTEHGFIEQCIKENEGKVDNPGAYCASIVDKAKGTTSWRKKK